MRRNSGFTIMELLVAMTISTIVLAAIYSAYMSQQRSYEVTEEVSALQQNLRAAMYRLSREIRMAGYDPRGKASVGFHNVTTSGQSSIEISWDGADGSNPNGTGEDPEEHIVYQLSGSNLQRQIGSGGFMTIAESISGVSFTFRDGNGNPTNLDFRVRSVDIVLDGTSEDGHERQLTNRVYCRNMGL